MYCRYCELACPYGARSFGWETFEGDNPAVPSWGTGSAVVRVVL